MSQTDDGLASSGTTMSSGHNSYITIVLASLAMFINSYALTNLFPYVGPMMVHFEMVEHIDKAGYYAGALGGSFMAARVFTSFLWGELSDTYGRRPILLIGCLSFALFQLMFAFSVNFKMAVLSRLLLGLFNPLVAVAKTVASEAVPEGRQKTAFSTLSGFASLGQIMGPVFGGWLSDPVRQYPSSFFGQMEIFKLFPYALPNLFGAFLSVLAGIGILLWLPETGKPTSSKEYTRLDSLPQDEETGETTGDVDRREKEEMEGRRGCCKNGFFISRMVSTLKDGDKYKVVKLYTLFSFLSIFFSELLPLWMIATKAAGGLGYPTTTIGTVLSIVGIGLLLFQLLIFPMISNRLSAITMTIYASAALAVIYMTLPLIVNLDRMLQNDMALVVILTVILIARSNLNTITFTCINVMVNFSTLPEDRGAMNGLVMSVGSAAKAFGPFLSSEMFAMSVNMGFGFPFDYHFSFYFLATLSIMLGVFCSRLPERLNRQRELSQG